MSHKSLEVQLFSKFGERLYLNQHERDLFKRAASNQPDQQRSFALILFYTGCRPSEARALTKQQVDFYSGTITLRSLKKRGKLHFRQVPIPRDFADDLKAYLDQFEHPDAKPWSVNRSTAFRWIKAVMKDAGIFGAKACPRALRHSFATKAALVGVPPNLTKDWMGHSDVKITLQVYQRVVGQEARTMAKRMW